jgi:hypothetical protein
LPPPIETNSHGLDDAIELYAAAIDTSDFVERVAPAIRRNVPAIGRLLDIGAGGGQLGNALRDSKLRWTAVEPSVKMRLRLERYSQKPDIFAARWEETDIAPRTYDTVLAANLPSFFQQAETFLDYCLSLARNSVVWVVPAQHGPHGLIFAGCLPAAWHCEDETPGIVKALQCLPLHRHPPIIAYAEWTFSAIVSELGELATYLADRLGWPETDCRREELARHLTVQAKPDVAGLRLDIPRKSAVLVWPA